VPPSPPESHNFIVQKLQILSRQLVCNGYPGDRLGRDTIMNGTDEHALGWLMHA
jgi:hypothetical protein